MVREIAVSPERTKKKRSRFWSRTKEKDKDAS